MNTPTAQDIQYVLDATFEMDENDNEAAVATRRMLDATASETLCTKLGLPDDEGNHNNPILPAVLIWAGFQLAIKQGYTTEQVMALAENLAYGLEALMTDD